MTGSLFNLLEFKNKNIREGISLSPIKEKTDAEYRNINLSPDPGS